MQRSRREFIRNSIFLSGAAGLNFKSVLADPHHINQEGNRLVLLGTQGGPLIRSYKQTPSSNLIVYKGMPLIIDTGYGATFKIIEAGINLASLGHIFITHLHSDHYLDLGPLLYNAWISGQKNQIHIYAPAGIKSIVKSYLESNKYDIDTRIKDEGRPDLRKLITVHEIKEGLLLVNSDLEISALKNIHPPIKNSFAFRFKLETRTIVFSGDTAYCPALVDFAMGADYLVHEVMYLPAVDDIVKRRPNATKLIASIKSHHTNAEDVGRIAQAAGVKNLILNHFVPPDDKSLNDQTWLTALKSTYSGNIIIGKDLAQFEL